MARGKTKQVAESQGSSSTMLIVETANGVFVRRIAPSTLLPPEEDPGAAAERATRHAAARWGLPDFVFRPNLQRKGAGLRELGDAVLVVGSRAAAIQVKIRPRPSSSAYRERAWLDKKIDEGNRQAAGTIRSLQRRPAELTNGRERSVTVDGSGLRWVSVVVIDHPGVENYMPHGSAVVLYRRDWEFLFDQLKSTYAVLEYLERVGQRGHIPLGTEPVRYYELAHADQTTRMGAIDPRLNGAGFRPESAPLLPMKPVPQGELIRSVLEDIATTASPETPISAVLEVLAAVDAAPVSYRERLSSDIFAWLSLAGNAPADEVHWRFRRHYWTNRPYLIFGAAPRYNDVIAEAFETLVRLRHQEHLELFPERPDLLSVGVLLTPRHDGVRAWDTTAMAVRGPQDFDPLFRRRLEELWKTQASD